MFWKKKNSSEVLISFESDEVRSSFRVSPRPAEPIVTELGGKPVTVSNIGAAGMAFQNNGFRRGDTHSVSFELPGENVTVHTGVEILDIDGKGVCHCRFVGLPTECCDAIHRYMLAVQIREARIKKRPPRELPFPKDGSGQEDRTGGTPR